MGIFLRQFGFGVFCVVFAVVAAGSNRQKAIFVFFSTTFRTIASVTPLLQRTSPARSDRICSADSSFLSWIHADALFPSGSLESPRGNRKKSSYSETIRKPLQIFVNQLTGLFSKSRRTSHGEKFRRAIYVACAFASQKTPFLTIFNHRFLTL